MTLPTALPDIWLLQARMQIPRRPGPLFWTGQDYTDDIGRALQFSSELAAMNWLRVHKHLIARLSPVAVQIREVQS